MDNRYFSLILARARTELPGASDNGIKQVLWSVFNQFFDMSSAWIENIPFNTVVDEQTYVVTPVETPPGRIVRLGGVMDASRIGWSAVMDPPGTILLRDAPSNVIVLTAQVIKSVDLPAESVADPTPDVPTRFLQQWMDAFVFGIQATMMAQTGKSYTNVPSALMKTALFEREIANARVATLRRNTYGTNAWVYPQQFRTRGQRGGVSVGNANSF